jgi:hypothetical protein
VAADVALVDQQGNVRLELDGRFPDLPGTDWEPFPLLRGVDPHGDTAFNALQMRRLAPELDRLAEALPPGRERDAIVGIRDMCVAGQRPPHQMLWFYGD